MTVPEAAQGPDGDAASLAGYEAVIAELRAQNAALVVQGCSTLLDVLR